MTEAERENWTDGQTESSFHRWRELIENDLFDSAEYSGEEWEAKNNMKSESESESLFKQTGDSSPATILIACRGAETNNVWQLFYEPEELATFLLPDVRNEKVTRNGKRQVSEKG